MTQNTSPKSVFSAQSPSPVTTSQTLNLTTPRKEVNHSMPNGLLARSPQNSQNLLMVSPTNHISSISQHNSSLTSQNNLLAHDENHNTSIMSQWSQNPQNLSLSQQILQNQQIIQQNSEFLAAQNIQFQPGVLPQESSTINSPAPSQFLPPVQSIVETPVRVTEYPEYPASHEQILLQNTSNRQEIVNLLPNLALESSINPVPKPRNTHQPKPARRTQPTSNLYFQYQNCIEWLIPIFTTFPTVVILNLLLIFYDKESFLGYSHKKSSPSDPNAPDKSAYVPTSHHNPKNSNLANFSTQSSKVNAENYYLAYMFLSGLFTFSVLGICISMSRKTKFYLESELENSVGNYQKNFSHQIGRFLGKVSYVVFLSSLFCAVALNPGLMFICGYQGFC